MESTDVFEFIRKQLYQIWAVAVATDGHEPTFNIDQIIDMIKNFEQLYKDRGA